MRRFLTIYLALLVLGGLLWPSFRGTGLFELPGDMVLSIDGHRLAAPFATSLIIAATVTGVWRLLEPR